MNKLFKFIRWFYPGLKVKRWISLFLIGIFLILISSTHLSKDTHFIFRVIYTVIFASGVICIVGGVFYFVKSLFEAVYPHKEKDLIDIIYEKRFLSKGPKIVAVGGGTGLSTVLEGLKEYTSNISAIVTVADEGGSSGRLREEFRILPPGDIRNCLVSLAEAPKLMRDLFQYRFQEGEGIKGHSFGNILITALTEITGSFKDAVKESSKVLAIRGKVLPSSLDNVRLYAEYIDGSIAEGENKIAAGGKLIKRIYIKPPDAEANPEAIEAIKEADIIVLGPGSLFTSILPNLLIKEISKEIAVKEALKIYICNVMTQRGETDGFTVADHTEVIFNHTHKSIVNYCLVNAGRMDSNLLLRYSKEKSFPVVIDRARLKEIGVEVIEDDLVSRINYLRHDSDKTAKAVIRIYNEWKRKWTRLNRK